MTPILDDVEARVLDDVDQDRINNLLERRKSNVRKKVVLLLFLQIEEVLVMPIQNQSSLFRQFEFTFREL
jgi:hypothetical protein